MTRAVTIFLLSLVVASLMSHALGGSSGRTSRNKNRRDGSSSSDIVPGVVVVKLRHSYSVPGGPAVQSQSPLMNAFAEHGVTSLARAFPSVTPLSDAEVASGKIDLSQIHIAAIPPDLDLREVASRLAQLPQVEYAEPKYYSHLCDVPNDSGYIAKQQVYFDRMNVPAAWSLQKGSPSVVIATVDGGTNWEHPDLLPNIWFNPREDLNHDGIFERFPAPGGDLNRVDDDGNGFIDDVVGWNFTNMTNNPRGFQPGQPRNADHGTATASAFGAATNNGRGMAGTAWNCRVMAVCAADPTSDDNIVWGFEGITYASRNGARVINCSWGHTGNYSQMEQDVVTAATQAGALIVAAVDDHHQQTDFDNIPFYPASYQHVLSVGSTADTSDALAYFSEYGVNISVFAPGINIQVARDDGSYRTVQGTSFSSPLVAGLAGLLTAAHPGWTPDQIAEQIRMTADPIDASNPGYAGSLGHGRVNFGRALSEVHSGVTVSGHVHAISGRPFFLEGDTLILSVTVKNILFAPAQNLSFNVSVDSALLFLGGAHAPTHLVPGGENTVDFTFRVGNPTQTRDVSIKLGWVASGGEWDARTFKATLYATRGFWQKQKSPTSTVLTDMKAVDKHVVWATGNSGDFSTGGVILRTTDGGENWMNVTGNLPNVGTDCIFAIDSLHAWVGTGNAEAIYATTDGGLTWSHQVYPSPQSGWMDAFWFFDANNGYALGDPGSGGKFVVLQSTNGGTTWSHLANEPTAAHDVTAFVETFCWTDKNHGWFGGSGGLVWRTTDAGATWSHASIGQGVAMTTGLAMRDDSVGVAGGDTVLARTTDGGATWQTLSGAGLDLVSAVAFPAGSTCAWVSSLQSVVRSSDNGESWVLQPTYPVTGELLAMSFSDPTNGWIATTQGEILRYQDLGPTTGLPLKNMSEVSVRYLLEQNYPNPFNPTTVVRYHVPVAGTVRLVVYDILGREVSVLVNERKAPGSYSVKFDASGLASGVYLYRLQAGNFVQTKKSLVVK